MNLEDRIKAFSHLGEILRNALAGNQNNYITHIDHIIVNQHLNNPWFTPDNVRRAVTTVAEQLTYENLVRWTDKYPELNEPGKPAKVGVIMAGNLPLVGFHDFLSVLISGNSIIAKTSSKDPDLIRLIGKILCDINPEFSYRIEFTNETIHEFDSVIATGSDNSSRYFEYYFGKYPKIIRKNRSSIAIIEGNERQEELEALGMDIFSYFGLGCRNVSKLFIPGSYDLSLILKSWERYGDIIKHPKYASNYDFSKAVFLVNKEKFIDSGFLLMKEDQRLASPVSVVYLEHYNSIKQVRNKVSEISDRIQCIIGHGFIPFGNAQSPALWDYADGIDTLEFLAKKKLSGNIVQ
jgi:hypothetical protein